MVSKVGQHKCYVGKAAATATSAYPSGWPLNPLWPIPVWPNPAWPPNWPIADSSTYYFTMAFDGTVGYTDGGSPTNQETIGIDIFDDAGKTTPSSGLEYHVVTATCVNQDGDTVQMEKTGDGEGMADTLSWQVTNYAGANYGFSDDITFDLALADVGDILTLTLTIASIDPEQTTSKNGTVVLVVP